MGRWGKKLPLARGPLYKNSKILHDHLIDEVAQGKFVNSNQANFC